MHARRKVASSIWHLAMWLATTYFNASNNKCTFYKTRLVLTGSHFELSLSIVKGKLRKNVHDGSSARLRALRVINSGMREIIFVFYYV